MSRVKNLMGLAVPAEQAGELARVDEPQDLTGAGSAITDAALVRSQLVKLTTLGGGAGVILPADAPKGAMYRFWNRSGQTVTIYPHSATATIEGGSGGAGQTLASTKHGEFVRWTGTDWLYRLLD